MLKNVISYSSDIEGSAPAHDSFRRTPFEDVKGRIPETKARRSKTAREGFHITSKRQNSGVYVIKGGNRTVNLFLGEDQLWHWTDESNPGAQNGGTRLKRDARSQVVSYLSKMAGNTDTVSVEDE